MLKIVTICILGWLVNCLGKFGDLGNVTDHIYIYIFNRLLIVHGSWVKAHGPGLKARGSRLMARGQEKLGARARAWGTQRKILLGHEP